jgi:hypothetical protein
MQRLAVALIDALGFKGIWKRVEEPRLIGALRRYRDLAGRMTSNVGQWPSPVKVYAQSISDSLLFATAADEHTQELDQRMIELLGVTVALLSLRRSAVRC